MRQSSGDRAARVWVSWLPFVTGFVLLSVGLLNVHLHKEYTSDDVAQQVMLRSVTTGGGVHRLYESGDSFIVHFPLYWLINLLSYGTRSGLLVTVYVLGVVGYALFFAAASWLLNREGTDDLRSRDGFGVLAPLLWPVLLGSSFLVFLANPNLRNVEIGVAFGCLALAIGQFSRDRLPAPTWRNCTLAGAGVVLLGLFFYSDPYLEYVFFGPLAALSGLSWLRQRRRHVLLLPMAFVGAAALTVYGWRAGLQAAGFIARPVATDVIAPTAIPAKVSVTASRLLAVFNADLTDAPARVMPTLLHALYLVPLVLLFVAHRDAGVRRSLRESFVHKFLLVQIAATVALYVLSTNAVDETTSRYLVVVPFSAAVLAAVVVNRHTDRRRAKFLALTATVVFGALTLGQNITALATWREPTPTAVSGNHGNPGNVVNAKIVAAARANGLNKGYADYWDANVNTFFSKDDVQFLPVTCSADNRVAPYYWLLDTYRLNRPASRTFFLRHTRRELSASAGSCGAPGRLARQFGEPSKVIHVTRGIDLYIYDGDILTAMPGRQT